MKHTTRKQWALSLLALGAFSAYAQAYPTAKPRPRPSATASPSSNVPDTGTPSVSPTPGSPDPTVSASPTTKAPSGPLKMITTQGERVGSTENKNSPISITQLDYLDNGYGARYNSEVRAAATIQNTGKKDVKKVIMHLQFVNGDGQVVQEWKQDAGTVKPNGFVRITPPVWRNTLNVTLHARVLVEHEEVAKEATPK